MTIRPSPIVALNRAIAVAQNEGPERGLEEIRLITDCDRLAAYPAFPRRSASSNFAVGGTTPRASTSEQRSHWRATRWSAGSSIAASARANQAARRGRFTNNFGKLISKPRTESEELEPNYCFGCPGASHDHPMIAGPRGHLALDVRA